MVLKAITYERGIVHIQDDAIYRYSIAVKHEGEQIAGLHQQRDTGHWDSIRGADSDEVAYTYADFNAAKFGVEGMNDCELPYPPSKGFLGRLPAN